MNGAMIRYILGYILKIEAGFLLLPCIVAVIYREPEGFSYVFTALVCGVLGILITRRKPQNTMFFLKESCVVTALSWILMSLFGCLPFWLSGEIPSFINALFETVSGFTTTGASILSDVEALSHCALFWRSFTHWIGGMGVLVFLLAVLPLSGGSRIHLMRVESPGPSVGKLVPKLRQTARILYFIYIGLTAMQILFLLAGNMPLFDSLTITFGTAGTGGFGIKNDSMASYSPYIQWVTTVFMLLFGINFNAFYFLLLGQLRKLLHMEEVRCYLLILLASTAVVAVNIYNTAAGAATSIREAAFQVVSIMTTTGYTTTNFNLWPGTSKILLLILMLIGACAGSTGGGIKISRLLILIKSVFRELRSYLHPNIVRQVKLNGKSVEPATLKAVHIYFAAFIGLSALSLFAISFDNYDFVTNFSAVATAVSNSGPGLGLVGPDQNFDLFSIFSKCVLIFDMLAGRLEFFPVLLLFHPLVWKEMTVRRAVNQPLKK